MSENTQVATQNTGAVAQKPKTFDVALMEKLDSVNDALPKDFNKQRFVQNTLALSMTTQNLWNTSSQRLCPV